MESGGAGVGWAEGTACGKGGYIHVAEGLVLIGVSVLQQTHRNFMSVVVGVYFTLDHEPPRDAMLAQAEP